MAPTDLELDIQAVRIVRRWRSVVVATARTRDDDEGAEPQTARVTWRAVPLANVSPVSDSVRMTDLPTLSVSALHELRRIHTKHLIEVFATPETHELIERGCIDGRFAAPSFIIEAVTPIGLAVLDNASRA